MLGDVPRAVRPIAPVNDGHESIALHEEFEDVPARSRLGRESRRPPDDKMTVVETTGHRGSVPVSPAPQREGERSRRSVERRSRRRHVALLVGVAGASLVLFVGLYVGAVRTHFGQRVDEAALVGRATHGSVQRATNQLLDTISITSLVLGSIALALIAFSRRRPRLAIGVVLTMLGANLTTQLLKGTVLGRPDLLLRPDGAAVASFPSGHATVAMSLGLCFMLVAPPRLRTTVGCGGAAYAVLVGAATLTARWHRPSDVIGAYLIATIWVAALAAWLIGTRGTGADTRPWSPMVFGHVLSSRRMLTTGVWLLGGAFVVSAAVLIVVNGGRLSADQLGSSYVAAIAAIAGTALIVLGALLAALQGALLDAPESPPSETPRGASR